MHIKQVTIQGVSLRRPLSPLLFPCCSPTNLGLPTGCAPSLCMPPNAGDPYPPAPLTTLPHLPIWPWARRCNRLFLGVP